MSKLTIYFTSDTHGYLYPTNFSSKQPLPMGLLPMSFPKDENTLVIDGGDTIQGSPLTYFCKLHNRELPIAQAMNDRGYDYVTCAPMWRTCGVNCPSSPPLCTPWATDCALVWSAS